MLTKRMSTFRLFLITYLIIITVQILISSVLYGKFLGIMNQYNEQKYFGILSQAEQIINQYFTEVNNIPKQILSNRACRMFLSGNIYARLSEEYNPSSVLESREYLGSHINTNLMLKNIYLYSAKNDTFVDYATAIKPADFYGSLIKFGDMDYIDVKNNLLTKPLYQKVYPQMSMISQGEATDAILHITSIPLWEKKDITGSIIIVIDKDYILSAAKKSLPSNKGFFYFYNADGSIITQSENSPAIPFEFNNKKSTEKIDGVEYIIFRTDNASGFNYALAIPEAVVNRGLAELRATIFVVIFLCTLICCLIAIFFAKINIEPLHGVIETLNGYLKSENNTDNEYTVLSGAINKLIDSDTKLRQQQEKNLPILRSNFVRSLIEGNITNSNDLEEKIEQVGLNITGNRYSIIVISILGVPPVTIESIEKLKDIKMVIKNKFPQLIRSIYTDTNETNLVFLAFFDTENDDDIHMSIENSINSLSDELYDTFSVTLKVSASEPHTKLTDIFYLYHSTKEALDYGIQTTYRNTIWCVKSVFDNTGYYYPLEAEIRIINFFKMGNIDSLYETLDNILDENNRRLLTANTMEYLYFDIKSTIYKILDKLDSDPTHTDEIEVLLKSMGPNMPLLDFFQLTKNIFEKLMNLYNNNMNKQLSLEILEYIEHSYRDPNLSRQSFAEYFNISEEYVTKFFKTHTNYNFSEYVKKIRMEAACNLLCQNNQTIETIASQVGYNSSVAFRRAFKAYTGLSPREYKQQVLRDTADTDEF